MNASNLDEYLNNRHSVTKAKLRRIANSEEALRFHVTVNESNLDPILAKKSQSQNILKVEIEKKSGSVQSEKIMDFPISIGKGAVLESKNPHKNMVFKIVQKNAEAAKEVVSKLHIKSRALCWKPETRKKLFPDL